MTRPKSVYAAVWILYIVSFLGLMNILTSFDLKGTSLYIEWLDSVAYLALLVVAFLIGIGIRLAKYFYMLLAIIWYVVLITFLSRIPGHPINAELILTEVLLIITAMSVLHQHKALAWFREHVKAHV